MPHPADHSSTSHILAHWHSAPEDIVAISRYAAIPTSQLGLLPFPARRTIFYQLNAPDNSSPLTSHGIFSIATRNISTTNEDKETTTITYGSTVHFTLPLALTLCIPPTSPLQPAALKFTAFGEVQSFWALPSHTNPERPAAVTFSMSHANFNEDNTNVYTFTVNYVIDLDHIPADSILQLHVGNFLTVQGVISSYSLEMSCLTVQT
ncbi:hypothetical protein PCASD_23932 [Puccinia coronata f. sp. avenae]|uniref:Uncharacterized protein n=1 Tax=Puccinia coronata f. sp. avenae TaxID=200324 RepID=A0A2N5S9Y2_9BASI|nr:hypothetical protein PCASD_23932 [Puccinia coronata f. sp. avenae]